MIDTGASDIIIKQLNENKIDVLLHTDIKEVLTKNNKLVGVKTDQGETIECEILIAAKGVEPNTELAVESTGIVKRKGIVTDQYMRTNRENVFAAGDAAEAYDIVLDNHTINALWTCAVQQGRIAGLNIAGQPTPYNGAVGMNSLNVCNVSLISFGVTAPEDESKYRILVQNQPGFNIYKRIFIGNDNRIKGIILLGKIMNAGVLLSLIQRKIDVSLFEDELLSDRFNYGTLIKYGIESFKD
jgi:NAD(P)H-nitrite reductase large subunit